MAFVSFDKKTGIVTGYQELPEDQCYLLETEETGTGEISTGQLERVKECRAEGVALEFKSGRLYEVSE
ncbi:hypothetical protein SAMN05421686_10726 [Thalassolituus maritimus]|uniref:Uncharacterized protein n=1 Tax=Thalassolituus maritimus TaxID=484498 RepID=A0A1N7NHZ7_9GAMM|nr:hypothetical protein [Thalassolituus maritimus]SIS97881.1 hypothetical protein SAMN05421686_10726 [Thalassolituus maritimus]